MAENTRIFGEQYKDQDTEALHAKVRCDVCQTEFDAMRYATPRIEARTANLRNILFIFQLEHSDVCSGFNDGRITITNLSASRQEQPVELDLSQELKNLASR